MPENYGLMNGYTLIQNTWGNLFYKTYGSDYKTFRDARDRCRSDGAYLAYPTSHAENSFIAGLLSRRCFWLGVNDIDQEGKWVTDDGRMVSYVNWADNKPSNGTDNHDGVKICGSNITSSSTWYDDPTNNSDQFICYFRINRKSEFFNQYGLSTSTFKSSVVYVAEN